MIRLVCSLVATLTLLAASYAVVNHTANAVAPTVQVADGPDPGAPPLPLTPSA